MPECRVVPRTVVLVEDDGDVRASMAWMLEGHGFTVEAFGHPADFLLSPPPPAPCCVVLDLRLPEVSGIEVLCRMRARGDATPVILVTGHGDPKAEADARDQGAFDFLEKPFNEARLVDCLGAAMRAAGQGGTGA